MGDWKLIQGGKIRAGAVGDEESDESVKLFDVRTDRSETKDVSDVRPEVVARLQKKLAELKAEAVEPNIAILSWFFEGRSHCS